MISPWSVVEAALDGGLGPRIKKAAGVALVAIVVVGATWHAPEHWLLHQYTTWKTHELQAQIWKSWHLIQQHQVQLSKPPQP